MDEHFSKKLRDLEITPSERANALFRSRMEQLSPPKKEKKTTPYWATAAAIIIALGFLFFLRFLPGESSTAVNFPAEETTTETSRETPVELPAVLSDKTETPLAEVTPLPPVIQPAQEVNTPSVTVTEDRAPEKPLRADLPKLSPEISYRYQHVELTDFSLLDVHMALELETDRPAPDLTVAGKPLPLLARVVREVKYVANGEKPDLDRAGLKPAANAIAYNQSGLLANESRQVKERIDQFREIFR